MGNERRETEIERKRERKGDREEERERDTADIVMDRKILLYGHVKKTRLNSTENGRERKTWRENIREKRKNEG